MNDTKVVAITLCRRPVYTRQLLAALSECYGADEYTYLISCDHDERYPALSEYCVQLAEEWLKDRRGTVFVNKPRLGIDLNKLFLIPKAFALSDFVIFLEDDTIPGKDALRYFAQVGERLENEPEYFSICGYNRVREAEAQAFATRYPYGVRARQGFCPWGWATWRDRWDRFFSDDGGDYKAATGEEANGRFDWFLHEGRNHLMAYPLLPRIQSVGGMMGEHTPGEEWHREHEYNAFGVWSLPEIVEPTRGIWNVSRA